MIEWTKYGTNLIKGILGLSSLIAAVVAVLTFYQSPESAMELRLISQSSLQPIVTKDKNFDLKITIDGTPVSDPYLSVLQLVNTGNKPILSRDFESPLEIAIGESGKIIRAQVTEVSPLNLKPVIKFDTKQIHLQPLLLNAHDTITLSILSTDGAPTFQPSARISGVESLQLSLLDKEKQNPYFTPTLLVLILLTTIASNAMIWRSEISKTKVTTISWGTAWLSNTVLLYLTMFMIVMLIPRLGFKSVWLILPIYIAASLITLPIVKKLEKRPSNYTQNEEAQTV